MSAVDSRFGVSGMAFGGLGLLVAVVHFFGGPFSPQPSLEHSIAEKAVAIRDATVAALKGDEIESVKKSRGFDLDRILALAAALSGGLAVILGVVGYARKESTRIATGAGILGGLAIAFQFAAIALVAIVFAIILAAILPSLDFG